MKYNGIDIIIIFLFYLSIIVGFYYNGLSQSDGHEIFVAPLIVLLLPFGVAMLQIVRILTLFGRVKLTSLSQTWIYIFIYYLFASLWGLVTGCGSFDYNTVWFIICPPISWCYFDLVINRDVTIRNTLIHWSFGVFIAFALIFLYFIPRSINTMGFFASLNTGYYVLMAYPLVMMDRSRIKKIIASVLMVVIILLSMKRGGILCVALSFAIYVLLATQTNIIKKTVVVAISIGILYYIIPIVNEYSNGTLQARYEFTQNEGDEEGRASMYPTVWNAVWISDLPEIVFGHGHNAVVNKNIVQGLSAHNDYLEFLYDYGLVGLFLLLLYQKDLFYITRKAYKQKTNFYPAIFAFTTIIVLSCVSVVYALHYFLVAIPFWCVINGIQKEKKNTNYENRNFNI